MDTLSNTIEINAAPVAQDSTAFAVSPELFGVALYRPADFWELAFRFGLNLIVAVIIIRFIYYSFHKKNDHLFRFLFSTSPSFSFVRLCATFSSAWVLHSGCLHCLVCFATGLKPLQLKT